MAYVRMDDDTRTICAKFGLSGTFDPYAMTTQEAVGFVAEISAERQRLLDNLTKE